MTKPAISTNSARTLNEESSWRVEILEAIRNLGHRYELLYSDQGQLDHYDRLMADMNRRFGDPALTRSAFLHGVSTESLKTFRARVGEEEQAILREWEQLRQLDPAEEGFGDRLEEETLPLLRDVRSAILLVYERLDHLDPERRMAHWASVFRHRPFLLDPAPTQPERRFERFFQTSFVDFAEKVAAPIAQALGLWEERRVIRNAVLCIRFPERFKDLVSFASECARKSTWCDDHVMAIRGGLRKAGRGVPPGSHFKWEWRHVASLDEQFENLPRARWRQKAHHCGFVSIICPGTEACYTLLGRVHTHFEFRVHHFRDAIGNPTRSGYQALHTLVVDPRDEGRFIAVRMLPHESDQQRFALADARLLKLHRTQRRVGQEEIAAFTPKGVPRFLPLGATVLNFASSVDKAWVAHVSGALLNKKNEVDIFHPLSSRDVVDLSFHEEPRTLPRGWEQRVPAGTQSRIREGLWEAFRAELERAGREHVMKELGELEIDEDIIQIFFESGLADLLQEHSDFPKNGASWWCRQLGLLQLKDRGGDETFFEPELRRDHAELFVEKVKGRVEQLRVWDPVLEIDPRRASVTAVRRCQECQPGRRSQLAFTVTNSGALIIHRRGEQCALGADLIHRRLLSLDQYFVIETISRPGMAKEVLAVFADKRVDVVEMVARQLASTWGVARIEVEPIGPATIRSIEEDLRALRDVQRVFAPGDTTPSVFLNVLPPRLDAPRSPLAQPPPYICGPVIYDHHYFYGRDDEMNLLYHLLDRTAAREAEAGLMIFVSGPLKVGKTSLVRRFQRQLEQRQDQASPFICLYHKTTVRDSWAEVEAALMSQLKRKASEVTKYWEGRKRALRRRSLRGCLAELMASASRPAIVIAVDEVVRLLKNTQKESEVVGALERFRIFIERTPGVVMIWIGPLAPARNLAPELLDVLASSEPIAVRPFRFVETRALLRAEKLAPIHRIELSERAARSVQKLTTGDPFWVAHLGNLMWKHSEDAGPGPMRFTTKEVRQATMELIQQSTLFQGRIFPSGLHRKTDRLIRTILTLLAKTKGNLPRGRAEMSTGQLKRSLYSLGVKPSKEELEQSLEELSERGGVRRSGAGLDRWKISAPLLAKHLSYYFDKTGWGKIR